MVLLYRFLVVDFNYSFVCFVVFFPIVLLSILYMYVSMYVIIPIVVNKFCFAFHCLLRLLDCIFIIIFGFLYYFGNLVVYAIRLSFFFHFLLLKYICFASLRFFSFFLYYYYWNIIVLLLLLIFLLLYSIICIVVFVLYDYY